MQNVDQKCFLWSVLSCLHPIDHNAQCCSHYTAFENELNMTGITYPVELKQISKFEKQNADISVNVFGYGEE